MRNGRGRLSLRHLFKPQIYWDLSRVDEKDGPLQDELIKDLAPIAEGKELGRALSRLLSKINQLKLHTEWVLVGGKGYRIPPLAYKQLGPGRGILKSAGDRWFVARVPWLKGDCLREILYEITLHTLLDGSLVYLKRCPQCRRFFVAGNTRGQFCGTRCKTKFHNIRRLKEGYFSDWRNKKESQRRNDERRARKEVEAQKFKAFLGAARGKVIAGSEIALFIKKKIPGGWSTVNGWLNEEKNGKTPEQIWDDLPDQAKEILRDYWQEGTAFALAKLSPKDHLDFKVRVEKGKENFQVDMDAMRMG